MVFVVPNVGIGKNKNIHSARDLFDAIRSHIPKKKTFSFSFLFFSMENIVKVREEHLLRCENFNHHSYIFIVYVSTDLSVPILPAKKSNTHSCSQWESH